MVENLIQHQSFKVQDKTLFSSLAALPDEHPALKKHLDYLNEIIKAFAIKQGIKIISEIDKFKNLTAFVYQMVGMDGSSLDEEADD